LTRGVEYLLAFRREADSIDVPGYQRCIELPFEVAILLRSALTETDM
jgi:hypothetical protein